MSKNKTVANTRKRKTQFSEYKCDVCSKVYTDKTTLISHLKTHSNEVFSCPHCTHTTKTKKYLTKHIKRVHTPKTVTCNVCDKKFHFRCLLKRHMFMHTGEKPHKCNICGKRFTTRHSMKTHNLIHTDSKPYSCSFCKYACRDISTLHKHEARHMGIRKQFECKICNKRYKTKCILKMHIAEGHLDMDVKNSPCPTCGKMFKSDSLRNYHIKSVHKNLYSCTCEICGAFVKNKYHMASHLTTHSDHKPFVCSFENCDKRYKDKGTLKKHSLVHYPEKQYPCLKCGKRFMRKIRLKRHALNHREKIKSVFCDYCGKGFYTKKYLITHINKKHVEKQYFICDICGLITYNKPSIVMHLKYGHLNEDDKKCKICKKRFKMHKYLKRHYWVTHSVKYKVMQRQSKKPIEIKIEPQEYQEIEILHEVKVERLDGDDENDVKIDDGNDGKVDDGNDARIGDEKSSASPKQATATSAEDASRSTVSYAEIQMEQLCIERMIKPTGKVQGVEKDVELDVDCKREAEQHINELLVRARRKKEMKELERARQQYNKRIKEASEVTLGKTKIKYVKMNKGKTIEDGNKSNKVSNANKDESNVLNKQEVLKDDETVGDDEKLNDEANNSDDETVSEVKRKSRTNKLKINTHQCYVCFKLYETKEQLLQHCQVHFDVCNSTILKKCPLCDYVTKLDIARHMRNIHKVNIKLPANIKERKSNEDGSRFYYDIDNRKISRIEIIPSVKNLNRQAYVKMDRRRKEMNNRRIQRTKLVKKNGEWVVQKQNINVSDYVIPKIEDVLNVGSNDYFGRLKRLSAIARRDGKKIMYPCENCEKICQTLSALKLHSRKHEDNPKPFKPKVWKHKTETKTSEATIQESIPSKNRYEKPKPIVNRHKCDPKLREFYENNIKGGDIEFGHFLKIFNRMSKENVNDFEDLEKRTEFGIHYKEKEVAGARVPQNEAAKARKKEYKARKKAAFTRTIMISKKEHRRRRMMKKKLRERMKYPNN